MQYCDVSFQTQAMRMFNENIRQFVDKVRAEAIISSNIQREKVKNSPLTRLTFFITIKITPDTMENYEYITKKQVTIYYDFARAELFLKKILSSILLASKCLTFKSQIYKTNRR